LNKPYPIIVKVKPVNNEENPEKTSIDLVNVFKKKPSIGIVTIPEIILKIPNNMMNVDIQETLILSKNKPSSITL
jgi:hypothetical protein